jgi:hypothetical protein
MRKVSSKDYSFAKKTAHVKAAEFVAGHTCHWPGCTKEVKPAYWGCLNHWYKLPAALRRKIWLAYRPGQEDTKDPSPQYIAVAKEAQEWIAQNVQKV